MYHQDLKKNGHMGIEWIFFFKDLFVGVKKISTSIIRSLAVGSCWSPNLAGQDEGFCYQKADVLLGAFEDFFWFIRFFFQLTN